MHQTRKGNQWYFGIKAHIAFDIATGLTETVMTTAVLHDVSKENIIDSSIAAD